MRPVKRILIRIPFLLVAGILLLACDRHKSMRGYDFIPDMVYSRAYDTYSESPVFNDGKTMRIPPINSVPQEMIPFRYTIDSVSRARAGRELVNPFSPSDTTLEEGRLVFTTFCIGCHGAKGRGDGRLFSIGLYPLKPRDLTVEPATSLRDGQIFHTITLGFGAMGAHGPQIKPADRWKAVIYVRQLQKNARDSIAGG